MATLVPVDHDPFAQPVPKMVPVDHDPFAGGAGVDASKVSFGAPTLGKPVDTRKISYTDPGFTPNKPASQYTDADFAKTGAAGLPISPKVKGLVKNFTQDIMEAPQFPVKAVAGIVNAPDTVKAGIELGKGMVTTPLGFIPGVSEIATGKSAAENWETNPGVGAMLAVPALKGGKALVKGAANKAVEMVTGPSIEKIVSDGIEKGIRPGVEGNRTHAQQKSYMEKATEAVKSIIGNRDKLTLTDEFGEPITTLPKTLKQFSQSIDQTKHHIYEQYNKLAEQAGEQGASVPLNDAVIELQNFASTRQIKDLAPEVATYAEGVAERLSKSGTYSPAETQNAIKLLNNSLDSFYKDPSPATAAKAQVDALVVNHLRKALDSAIDSATGEAYQPLKNQYGALKSIERDVNRRSIIDARKQAGGGADGFFDAWTGAELAGGVLSHNPAMMAKAIAGRLYRGIIRNRNNPNRAVRRMFEGVDSALTKEKTRGLPEDVRPIEPGTGELVPKRNRRKARREFLEE